jgi:hypothetical protein
MHGIVYIWTPAFGKGGGSEALHQLADVLNRNGRTALTVYITENGHVIKAQTPICYRFYKIQSTTVIEDKYDASLVFPETMTRFAKDYNKSKVFIWWLSVDFFDKNDEIWNTPNITHLYQSAYAEGFLLGKKVKRILPLSDYTLKVFSNLSRKNKNYVLISGRKISSEMQTFQSLLKNKLDLKVLNNLSSWKIHKLFNKAIVYLDLGQFPGKDRMPREAVSYSCLPLIAANGAASIKRDFPIPEKFVLKSGDLIHQVERILEDYSSSQNFEWFNEWQKAIRDEAKQFQIEAAHIFDLQGLTFKGIPAYKVQFYFYLEHLLLKYYCLKRELLKYKAILGRNE